MNETVTRAEHLAWCKQRALEYLDRGEFVNALTSLRSDLTKHPETASSGLLLLVDMEGVRCVTNGDEEALRRLIEGCQ